MGWRIEDTGSGSSSPAASPISFAHNLRGAVDGFLGDHGIARRHRALDRAHRRSQGAAGDGERARAPRRRARPLVEVARRVGNLSSASVLFVAADFLDRARRGPATTACCSRWGRASAGSCAAAMVDDIFDVVVCGGGPAGLAAAIVAADRGPRCWSSSSAPFLRTRPAARAAAARGPRPRTPRRAHLDPAAMPALPRHPLHPGGRPSAGAAALRRRPRRPPHGAGRGARPAGTRPRGRVRRRRPVRGVAERPERSSTPPTATSRGWSSPPTACTRRCGGRRA